MPPRHRHPQTTLRAAARRRVVWCLLVVPILIAPCFHPTSSCSWRRLGVLSWWWSSGPPCHPLSSLLSSSCPRRHRCRHPALVVIVIVILPSLSSLLKVVGGALSARHGGYTRAGVLTWCLALSPLPSSSRPALVGGLYTPPRIRSDSAWTLGQS